MRLQFFEITVHLKEIPVSISYQLTTIISNSEYLKILLVDIQ